MPSMSKDLRVRQPYTQLLVGQPPAATPSLPHIAVGGHGPDLDAPSAWDTLFRESTAVLLQLCACQGPARCAAKCRQLPHTTRMVQIGLRALLSGGCPGRDTAGSLQLPRCGVMAQQTLHYGAGVLARHGEVQLPGRGLADWGRIAQLLLHSRAFIIRYTPH